MSDIEIEVEEIGRSEKALFIYDGKVKIWLPFSLISDYTEDNGKITSIFISDWLANEKGLI